MDLRTCFSASNCYILVKGSCDVIVGPTTSYIVKNASGLKRCGGLGDTLTGLVARYCYGEHPELGLALAAYINRKASLAAFRTHKLGMLASDLLTELPTILADIADGPPLIN